MFKSIPIFLAVLNTVSSFSAQTTTSPIQNFLGSLFPNTQNNNNAAVFELKQQLISECRANIGYCTPEIRQCIEDIMYQLSPLNPTKDTATSPLLQKEWILLWTSEKEINFFLEKGFSDEITQTLIGDTLTNNIPFVKGGFFGVTGEISIDEQSEGLKRTNFKFTKATLDLAKWGGYSFPPIGAGWFDTIYLDSDLRIDTNSRNDILICRADN